MVKKAGTYKITNSSGDTAEIEFIGHIGWWRTSAEDFREKIKELKAAGIRNLSAYINTPGGSLYDANEIVNELKAFEGEKKARLGALCASAGTVICNAFDHVAMAANGLFMIHEPWVEHEGGVKELTATLSMLSESRKIMIKAYADRTGLSEDAISKMVEAETWMSAETAKQKGFVHSIIGEDTNTAGISNEAIQELGYRHIPETLNLVLNPPAPVQNKSQNSNSNMSLKLTLAGALGIKGVTADTNDTEFATLVNNHVTAQAAQIKKLEEQVKATEEAAIKAFLDNAQNDSQKITAEQRKHFEAMANAGQFDAVKNLINSIPARKKIANQIGNSGPGSPADDRAGWDWDKWQKEDPKGLEALKRDDKETFDKLYNAKYRSNPQAGGTL